MPSRMLGDIGEAQLALALLRPHLAQAQQPRQPAIAVAVLRVSEQARRIGQIEPAADQRLQPRLLRRAVHPHHPGQRVAVGDADRVHAELERRQHQLDRVRRAAQEGERAGHAKLDERRRRDCLDRPVADQFLAGEVVFSGISRTARGGTSRAPRRGRRRSALRGRSSSGGRSNPRPGNNRAAALFDGARHHSGAIRSGPSTRAMSCTAAPPHEPPRHAFGGRINHRDRLRPVEQALGAFAVASSARRMPPTWLERFSPPARPLGQMALPRPRPPHPLRPELDAQPVDQPRDVARPRRLLDQALLRRAQGSVQLGLEREGVEAEAGIERRRLVGKQAVKMLRLAARDRGGDARRRRCCRRPGNRSAPAAARRAAAAPIAPRGRGSAARAPGPRPPGRSPAPPAAAGSAAAARTAVAVSGSGLRPSARSSASSGLSASRKRRASARRGTPASAPMVLRPSRSSVRTVAGVQPQRRDRQRRELRRPNPLPQNDRAAAAEPRQRPRRAGSRRDRDRGSSGRAPANRCCTSSTSAASPPNRCATPLTSSRRPSRAVDLDQRRPARRPAREPLDQRRVARRIGRDMRPGRVERPRIGQPRAGPGAAFRRRLGHRRDHRPVRALDGQHDRRVRRKVVSRRPRQRSIARCGHQTERIRGSGFMGDAPAPRRRSRARGTARRPRPALPARAGRTGGPSDGRLAIRQRIRAPLKFAAPPSRTSQAGTPDRSAATASRRVAVKSSAAGSPHSSPITAPSAAHLKPSSIAHSAERASRASTWMRSRQAKPRRIDPPGLEDRHPLLHPQQRLARARPGPAGTPPSRRRAGARRTVRTGWA